MLDGTRLYVDLWEVNPPLIAYLAALPVVLARMLDVDPGTAFRAFVLVLMAGSGIMAIAVARRRQPEFSFSMAYAAALTVALLLLPGWEFGQREHLLVALVCPGLTLLWLRVDRLVVPKGAAVLVGAAAGLGIALKPHFVLAWAVVEGWLLLRRRIDPPWRRPEAVTLVAILFAYGVFVLAVHPEIVAFARDVAGLYAAYDPLPRSLVGPAIYALPVAAAAVALLVVPQDRETRDLAAIHLAFGAAMLGVALLQAKGWRYHFYPPAAGGLVSLGVTAVGAYRLKDLPRRARARRVGGLAVAVTLLAVGVVFPTAASIGAYRVPAPYAIRCERSGDSILIFSSLLIDAFPPVLETGCGWAAPVPYMWPITAIYADGRAADGVVAYHPAMRMGEPERVFHTAVVEAFVTARPAVLVVETRADPFLDARFPYLKYFSEHPAFARALRAYRRHGRCGRFEIWLRRGIDPADDGPVAFRCRVGLEAVG